MRNNALRFTLSPRRMLLIAVHALILIYSSQAYAAETNSSTQQSSISPIDFFDVVKTNITFITVVTSILAAVCATAFKAGKEYTRHDLIKQTTERDKFESERNTALAKIEKLRQDNVELAKADRELILRNSHLKVAFNYESLETKLTEIVIEIGASCFGVFVPDPDPTNRIEAPPYFRYLAFLWGSGSHCGKWWGRRISVASDAKAAKVFRDPKSEDPKKVLDGKDAPLIAFPFPTATDCKAVIEFIDYVDGSGFTESRIEVVRNRIRSLAIDNEANRAAYAALTDKDLHDRVLEKRAYIETEATILVADISAFSETLLDVSEESMVPFLRFYFKRMSEIILDHGGTIEASLGDGLLVSFNARTTLENHNTKAIQSAINMQEAFRTVRERFLDTSGLIERNNKLFHRVSISSGPLIKADFSDQQGVRETILGRVVNEATKLCDIAPRNVDCIIYMADMMKSVAGAIDSKSKWAEEELFSDTLERTGISRGRKIYFRGFRS